MRAADYFDELAPRYDEEFADTSVWSIAHRIGSALLERHLPSHGLLDVLDAGCGTGKWGVPFVRAGHRVTFTDVSVRMVEAALASAEAVGAADRATGRVCPVEDLAALPDGSFDLVLCMGDPLSYCSDASAGVRELVRVCRPGGLVFVSTDSRLGYLRVFKERDGYDLDRLEQFLASGDVVGWEGVPLHAFSRRELAASFERAGAEAIGVWPLPTVSAYFLFDPAFRERLADRAFMARLVAIELRAVELGGAAGSDHLYGLFRRRA
jgi:SAM-dependent methyltransferase